MDNDGAFCCERMAVAFNQRQIVWSNDGGGSWNVAVGPLDDFALEGVAFCPWCGEKMGQGGGNWKEGDA